MRRAPGLTINNVFLFCKFYCVFFIIIFNLADSCVRKGAVFKSLWHVNFDQYVVYWTTILVYSCQRLTVWHKCNLVLMSCLEEDRKLYPERQWGKGGERKRDKLRRWVHMRFIRSESVHCVKCPGTVWFYFFISFSMKLEVASGLPLFKMYLDMQTYLK